MRLLPAGLLSWGLVMAASPPPAHAAEAGAEPLRIAVDPVNPWTHLDLGNDPDDFQFAIVADRTQDHRAGVFAAAVEKLNLLRPEFAISVGDLVEGYTEDPEQIRLEWDEVEELVGRLEMPLFLIPGNHDLSNDLMAAEWKRRFGKSYYHFAYRQVLFLCLNTEDGKPAHIGAEQRDYIAAALAENQDVRWTLVFMHSPLWNYPEGTGWAPVEELLAGRPYTVFAGHFHAYQKQVRHGRDYFVLATTGGSRFPGGPLFGQFDHLVWVTMTEQGPRLANLMLDGIRDENIRTEQTAALVDPLFGEWSVSMAPIFAAADQFQGGRTRLRLNNSTAVPLRLKGSFGLHAHLFARPDSVDVIVPPNSAEWVDLEVGTWRTAKVDELSPLLLHWQAGYQQEEVDLPAIEGASRLVVSRRFEAPGRVDPIVVDGDLGEWAALPFQVDEPAEIKVDPASWTGPEDCSWRFGLYVGPEDLYIGVEVNDDRPIYTRTLPWQRDGIEVRLDGRPDPERSEHRWGQDLGMKTHLFVALGPARPPDSTVVVEPELLQALGIRAVCAPTAKGHDTEIAIPLSYFEERQGAQWDAFRLNITVNDYDERPGSLAQLWWQPDWRGLNNYPGSGTFQRKP